MAVLQDQRQRNILAITATAEAEKQLSVSDARRITEQAHQAALEQTNVAAAADNVSTERAWWPTATAAAVAGQLSATLTVEQMQINRQAADTKATEEMAFANAKSTAFAAEAFNADADRQRNELKLERERAINGFLTWAKPVAMGLFLFTGGGLALATVLYFAFRYGQSLWLRNV